MYKAINSKNGNNLLSLASSQLHIGILKLRIHKRKRLSEKKWKSNCNKKPNYMLCVCEIEAIFLWYADKDYYKNKA